MRQFDYIIVGAGSAGCALADRLSENGRNQILVLEAGGSDRRFWIKTPIGYGMTFYDPAVNWMYQAEADPGLAGRGSYWPRGKVLGGSSSINAMVYTHSLPHDYDDWEAAGNPGWGWEQVSRTYQSYERRILADGSEQGSGPFVVSDVEAQYHPLKRFFYAAADEAGLPRSPDVNGPNPEGVGAYQINTRKGLRWSAADAFLRPALKRGKVHLETRAQATRILFAGRRAVGIAYRQNGKDLEVRCTKEVMLSGGAVNSPQLLQLSGIGPGQLLQGLGIPVVLDRPAVGGNLQDHLGINYFFRSKEPTLNSTLGTWLGRMRAGAYFLLTRRGPLSLSINQMGGLVKSDPSRSRANVQLYFNPISYSINYQGRRITTRPDPYPGFILSFNPCRPTSRGRIDLAAPDPFTQPRIQTNYLSTNEDLEDVVAGARLIGRMQNTEGFKAALSQPAERNLSAMSDAAIIEDFRQRCGTVFHPCGTCIMAPEDRGGVVDSKLRVHGIEGLRVVDASIFPNVTSGNTNAPSIMVGRKAGEMILEEAR